MDLDFATSHPSVKLYLDYVERTESPRLFHIWSFLSGVSASMGRRCWLPMGTGEIWPNMFVILTGPPAVRKSTAFRITSNLLRSYTSVRFAPDDTGGQRQGLIAAMMNCSNKDNKDEDEIISRMAAIASKKQSNNSTTSIADLAVDLDEVGNLCLDTRDPRTMFIAASELNSILGEGNTALLTFLQKMWDGDAYKYQLKNTTHELKDALLGIIGATTPSQLALAMPPEAVGQGFTSRAIFIYADQKHARKIARPKLREDLEHELGAIFSKISSDFDGPFIEEPNAANELDKLYERGVVITDPRFVHYADRRHTHLQKLSMALAASRGEQTIRLVDVKFADQLLLYTEQYMPDALGEYGMNKLGAAKQRLLDFLKQSDGPIPINALYGMLSRDMTMLDFKQTIVELHNAGKLTRVGIPKVGECIVAVSDSKSRKARQDLSEIEQLMWKTS
jgi:hypothetical protein